MRRIFSQLKYVIGLILVLGGVALGVARGFVGGETFKSQLQVTLDGAFKELSPGLIVSLASVELDYYANFHLYELVVRDVNHPDTKPLTMNVTFRPQLPAALWKAAVPFTAEVEVVGGGKVFVRGVVPRRLLAGREAEGALELEGEAKGLNAPELVRLFAPPKSQQAVKFEGGDLTGKFIFAKPQGPGGTNRQTGRFNGKLSALRLGFSGVFGINVKPPPLELNIEVKDLEVKLVTPVVFSERIGRITLDGGFSLPADSGSDHGWNLNVDVKGPSLLTLAVVQLFRCAVAPSGPKFNVSGPATAPKCERISGAH